MEHENLNLNDAVICCCDNCGLPETEQTIVEHYDENWCLDCMRQAGYCITCDTYIPDVVADYFNYEDDDCPACVGEQLHIRIAYSLL